MLTVWAIFSLFLQLVPGQGTAIDADRVTREGDAYFQGGDWSTAVKKFSSVLDEVKGSRVPLLYTKRAAAYARLRMLSHALKDLNAALEIDPTFVQGYIHRGKLQLSTCSFTSANRDFQKVLELQPEHAAAMAELQHVERARQLLEEAGSIDDGRDLDAVRAALQPLYEVAEDCGPAVMIEAQAHFKRSQWEEVAAVTGKLIKADPQNIQALVLRGRAYFYAYEHDVAKRHFGEALKYDPDHTEARTSFNKVKEFDRKKKRGDSATAEQDWVEAEKGYSDALHVDSMHRRGNMDLWLGLGKARYYLRRFEQALEAFENVLIIDSADEPSKAWVVRALLGLERWQDAVTKARDYFQSNQGSGELRQVLQEAEKQLKMSLRKDYYKVLGVEKTATDREIKRAYRDAAKIYHPDKAEGTEEERKVSENKFRDVAEAYEILSDEEKRRRFDNGEDQETQQQQQQQHPFHGGQQFHFQWGG